jgi:hypothetical protein
MCVHGPHLKLTEETSFITINRREILKETAPELVSAIRSYRGGYTALVISLLEMVLRVNEVALFFNYKSSIAA